MKISRRSFFGKTATHAAGIASIPMILSSCIEEQDKEDGGYALINDNDTILFQGDSITDAGRNRNAQLPNDARSFGGGYALMAAASLLEQLPEKNLTIYNRGISGNKVYQLRDRWVEDCIDLKPNVLSILIGVNDYWHKRNNQYDGTVEVYKEDFRALLKRTKEELPGIKLVICEPFSLTGGSAIQGNWQEEFEPYRQAAKAIADEFQTLWVPYQQIFDVACKHAPATYWSGDGVHPSMAGAQLMAQAWLKVVRQA
ncbi:SGNH/GDSL hydrolase family protein [Sunxiuqinia sp. A32]|uniref:SGNH/GDSL hydrolase family protein n=1 Tax=Sunxiuqinia sp. A32 TaxID=3461496 RepID=UPI004045BAD4